MKRIELDPRSSDDTSRGCSHGTEVDLGLLVLEAKRAGIPVRGDWYDFELFEAEADHLRRVVTSWPAQSIRPGGPAVGSIPPQPLLRNRYPNRPVWRL